MSEDSRFSSSPARKRPWIILAFAVIAFVALTILGLGMVSLITETDVIVEPGLSQIPGVIATILATVGFAAVTAPALVRRWAGLGAGVLAGLAAALAYVVGIFFGVVGEANPALAASVAGRIATSWFAAAVLLAGILAGVGAAVAVRNTSGTPRWPWEREDRR